MTDVFVDPDAATDGDGSEGSPWNTWASKTFVAGNRYLQKRGTHYHGYLTVGQSGTSESARIYFGAYGDGPKPILDGRDQGGATSRTIYLNGARHYITVDGFEIIGGNHATATNFGVHWGLSASPADHGVLLNCDIHGIPETSTSVFDHNGFNGYGDYFTMRGCTIFDIADDGFWLTGADPVIEFNYIHDIGQGEALSGDCLQLIDPGNYRVIGNVLDHSNSAEKQCMIAAVLTSASGRGICAFNKMVMKVDLEEEDYSCVYSNQANDIVMGNLLIGGNYGIQFVKDNQWAIGNVIVGSERGIVVTSAATNPKILNNTIVDCPQHGLYIDTVDAIIHNNILYGNGIGLSRQSTSTYSHNAYFGNTTASAFIGSAGSAEASTVTTDPQLDSEYKISSASPCRSVGKYNADARDWSGRRLRNPPDIGAHQYYAPRTATSGMRAATIRRSRG